MKTSSVNFLNRLTEIVDQQPVESLARTYPDGRWNVLQVLEHLNTYNRYYLPLLEQKITTTKTKPENEFRSGWLGNYFTKMMLPRPNGSVQKMKAFRNHVPSSTLNAQQVITEFLAGQRKLVHLLEQAASCNLNGNRIPITLSSLVRLQLGDVFRFIVAHNERHLLQIERNIGRIPPI